MKIFNVIGSALVSALGVGGGMYANPAVECDLLRRKLAIAERERDLMAQKLEAAHIADLNRHGEEKRDLEKFNDAQAARGMARDTKRHFQEYQWAVKQILDRLNDLGRQNVVTKEDLRKLRQLREDLSAEIMRSI